MEHWIIYDAVTGLELYAGQSSTGGAALQDVPEGAALIVVPQAVVAQRPRDLDLLRLLMTVEVENAAERARARYVTALPAQVGIYLLKANAIRRWLADRTASTAMFRPEANSRGMTLEALADEVLALEAQWEIIGGEIEGLRFGAKRRIAEATTIGAIAQAAVIDWSVLDAPVA